MSCRSTDRNSLIYCQEWFLKCFNPVGSERLQKAGWAFYRSPDIQFFLRDNKVSDIGMPLKRLWMAWELSCSSSKGASCTYRGRTGPHILCAQPALAILPRAFCSLCAQGDSSVCLSCETLAKEQSKLGNGIAGKTWRYSSFLRAASSSTETYLLPSDQWQLMPAFSLVFRKRWVIKFIIGKELC